MRKGCYIRTQYSYNISTLRDKDWLKNNSQFKPELTELAIRQNSQLKTCSRLDLDDVQTRAWTKTKSRLGHWLDWGELMQI